jgi:hypothetical protein
MYDLNEADDGFELVPPGIYRVKARLKPGGFGDERLLRLAKSMRTYGLELELTVIGGEHRGRKLFDLITVSADLSDSPELTPIDAKQADKYQMSVDIGHAKLRRMLESAHGIAHSDKSEQAQQIRRASSLRVFDSLEYWAEIDIKEAANGFRARNIVTRVLTAEMHDWPGEQPERPMQKPLRDEMGDDIPF